MTFVSNPRRDASPTIAGFVFQVNVTILRWLGLQENEHLELECGEDVDTVQKTPNGGEATETRLLEQIKARSERSITLRSKEALQALSNFCGHRATNQGSSLRFRYVTTAKSGFEQGWSRPESGIETWTALRRGQYDDATQGEAIAALRSFLRSCTIPDQVSVDSWQALQDVLSSGDDQDLTEIVLAFEWGTGHGDYEQSEREILAALMDVGKARTHEESNEIYEHLFVFVFGLLCQPGEKVLTAKQLREELAAPLATQADRAILQLVRNELGQVAQRVDAMEAVLARQGNDVASLKQTVRLIGENIGFDPTFDLTPITLSTELPDSVTPHTKRSTVVNLLLQRAQSGTVALVAEPGSGKTQLLILACTNSGRLPSWLNIPRDATEAQTCSLLDALVRSAGAKLNLPFRESYAAAAEQFRGKIVVLDDLPRMLPRGQLANRIEVLARLLKSVDAYLLVSSYFPLPATTEQVLGDVYVEVPRFTASDVSELLTAIDAPGFVANDGTCQLLVAVTEGLPILVIAAVRYIADRNWNFTTTELESLFRGEFASAHRLDANDLLQITVPDPQERELLVRLSLAIGVFSLEDIASVARVPTSIPLPGEKVKRTTGLWLQKVGNDGYLRSPLIVSSLADSLDPTTRKGVHHALALRILARKSIGPVETFACVAHLALAGKTTFAVMVVTKVLLAFLETEPIRDDFGFARMWSSGSSPSGVDINLQLYLRAMQIVVLSKQARDFAPTLSTLDTLLTEVEDTGWGAAIATGTLATHFASVHPILGNKYLLIALRSFAAARMPDGSPLPLPVREVSLESTLWVSACSSESDADVDSWLATIAAFTPAQIENLKTAKLAEDNVVILCDQIWNRVYLEPEGERDWSPVKKKLEEVEATARAIGFPLLEAAAIRARIIVLAEWEKDIDAALRLSNSALKSTKDDGGRFLLTEVTGRQLSYAGRKGEALSWLEQSLACRSYQYSLLRRNVLITAAELCAPMDPLKASSFTAEAVRVCEDGKLIDSIFSETLAEHGIALWKAGATLGSLEMFEEAANRLLGSQSDDDSWRGQFARLFRVIVYFSAIAENGKAQDGHVEPQQGTFLSSPVQAASSYRAEQLAYICIRLAMLADGVGKTSKAAAWTWRAIDLAKRIPAALIGVRSVGSYAMPATLLSDDFVRAARLAALMLDVDVNEIVAAVKASKEVNAEDRGSVLEGMIASIPRNAPKSCLLVIPLLPIALRLATLRFRGRTAAATACSLAEIEAEIPANLQPENFVAEMRKALVNEIDWQVLRNEAYRAMQSAEYLRWFVLLIGAISEAPVLQSLYLQTILAQQLEGFFQTRQSIYREIVAPFFAGYWERAIEHSTGLFRTALTYTQRQLEFVDGSVAGTRRLLSGMRFCLGEQIPESALRWLESTG